MSQAGWSYRGRDVTLLVIGLEVILAGLIAAGVAFWVASIASGWLAIAAFFAVSTVLIVVVGEVVYRVWPPRSVRRY